MSKNNELALGIKYKWSPERPTDVYYYENNERKYQPIDSDETKIDIYKDKINGWFFNYGDNLLNDNNSGFILLQISIGQIEGWQQYKRGESSYGKSAKFFKEGLKEVFDMKNNDHDTELEKFYKEVRCGLFHDGFTKNRVFIDNDFKNPIEFYEDHILISPRKFYKRVKEKINEYINDLSNKNSSSYQININNFRKEWNRRSRTSQWIFYLIEERKLK